MLFCPTCGNMLVVTQPGGPSSDVVAMCHTCPYKHTIQDRMTTYVPIERKVVSDVLGQDWDNAPKIETVCPKCSHRIACYFQIQIRSADEPMTTFYKCMKCGSQWNDD